MQLLLTMLPFYLIGNIHCLGMCGPLVMLLSHQPFRYYYFGGRIVSFTLMATLAAITGSVLTALLQQWHIGALVSLLFASSIAFSGATLLFPQSLSWPGYLENSLRGLKSYFARLSLRDDPMAIFLFGFCTVFLPCGQSLIVFSACALSQDASTGFLNGLAFSLLTTPALVAALRINKFKLPKGYAEKCLGSMALVVAFIAFLRALADVGLIDHLVVHENWHLVLY